MFILNNINDRDYRNDYPTISNVIFDISEKQLGNQKNAAWNDISEGSIVCVVKSSRKISTFFKIKSKFSLGYDDPEYGETHVLTGEVIAKLERGSDMEAFLNLHKVSHQYLPGNKFSIGFNVADIGHSIDSVSVISGAGQSTIGQLTKP
jgi:hypothetical protein